MELFGLRLHEIIYKLFRYFQCRLYILKVIKELVGEYFGSLLVLEGKSCIFSGGKSITSHTDDAHLSSLAFLWIMTFYSNFEIKSGKPF